MSDFLPKVGAVYLAPCNPFNMKVVVVEILADKNKLKYKIIEHDGSENVGRILEYNIDNFLKNTELVYTVEGFEV